MEIKRKSNHLTVIKLYYIGHGYWNSEVKINYKVRIEPLPHTNGSITIWN